VTDSKLWRFVKGPKIAIKCGSLIMDEDHKNMHTKSGLIKDIKDSNISIKEAELKIIKFLSKFKGCPLAGNRLAEIRAFLAKDMP